MQGQSERVPLSSTASLQMGLYWEYIHSAHVDLDASVVLFDAYGQVVDAAFYNQLSILNGAVTHSGDCRDGSMQGLNEVITIAPHLLPPNVVAAVLLVNTYNTGNFAEVGHAMASISTDGKEILRYAPACAGPHTGFVMGILHFLPQQGWHFKAVGQPSQGRNFEDCMGELHEALKSTVEVHNIKQYVKGQRFILHKGDTFQIPSDEVMMGLGWDPCRGPDMDVDAAVLGFTEDGRPRTVVYWGSLVAPGIQHKGDNLTGKGEGDDEQVILRLNQLPPEISTLLFVVNIYTPQRCFCDVEGEFCRLVDNRTNAELCRFEMDYMDPQVDTANNLIMCKMFRKGDGSWALQVLGFPVQGPRTAPQMADPTKNMVSPVLQNYSLTRPCYSPVPIDPNPKKKPPKKGRQKSKSNSGDSGDTQCSCTIA